MFWARRRQVKGRSVLNRLQCCGGLDSHPSVVIYSGWRIGHLFYSLHVSFVKLKISCLNRDLRGAIH